MENSFFILVMGKNGCYIVVVPNYKNRSFDQTNETVKANTLTPFGPPFPLERSEHIFQDVEKNKYKSEEDVAEKAFQLMTEKLMYKKEEFGADYVLISDVECSRSSTTEWKAECQCQLYVKIA